jgi:hypothetical protein
MGFHIRQVEPAFAIDGADDLVAGPQRRPMSLRVGLAGLDAVGETEEGESSASAIDATVLARPDDRRALLLGQWRGEDLFLAAGADVAGIQLHVVQADGTVDDAVVADGHRQGITLTPIGGEATEVSDLACSGIAPDHGRLRVRAHVESAIRRHSAVEIIAGGISGHAQVFECSLGGVVAEEAPRTSGVDVDVPVRALCRKDLSLPVLAEVVPDHLAVVGAHAHQGHLAQSNLVERPPRHVVAVGVLGDGVETQCADLDGVAEGLKAQ